MSRLTTLIGLALLMLMASACGTFQISLSGDEPVPDIPETPEVSISTPYPTSTGDVQEASSDGLRERSMAQRESAIEAIRAFVGDSSLEVTYDYTTYHSENQLMTVEVYYAHNPLLTQYMVSVEDNRVVYMMISEPGWDSPAGDLTRDELEAIALEFITTHNDCFAEAAPVLRYEIGGKINNVFFRWQSAYTDPLRPSDQPTFIQLGISADGTIFSYLDSGICYLPQDQLETVNIRPTPTDMDTWQTYTNTDYGFAFSYPQDWTLVEDTDVRSTMYMHMVTLILPDEVTRMTIAYKFSDDTERLITRTGVGAGFIMTRGAVPFFGKSLRRDILVNQGLDVSVLYGGGGEIARNSLTFAIGLDYTGLPGEGDGLTEEVQALADVIIQSFRNVR